MYCPQSRINEKKYDYGILSNVNHYDLLDVVRCFYSTNITYYYQTDYDKKYRFGFNGQEKDDEVAGTGNINTALYWEYDTRLGRRWNIDPKSNPSISDYACFANNPILNIDIYGDSLGVPANLFFPLNAGQEGYDENGLNIKDWNIYSNDIKNTTGISLNTPTPSDNVLTISSVDESVGSETNRNLFLKALNDKEIVNQEFVYDDPNVDGALWNGRMKIAKDGSIIGFDMKTSVLQIDMTDISKINYRGIDKRAFDFGFIVGHEIVHRYYGNEDAAVNTMNKAAREMGLPQRLSYSPLNSDWTPGPKLFLLRFGVILIDGQQITTGGIILPFGN